MSPGKTLIVLQGPTASGKTEMSIALAQHLNCEILSGDSRQFYKEISIGTAKPSLKEIGSATHHFINSHSIENPVSAAQFEKEALIVLDKIFENQNFAILVGGSGLFIDALCYGLDPLPSDEKVKKKWQDKLEKDGLMSIQRELMKRDPEYAEIVDLNNPHRVLRALEINSLSGKTMKEMRTNSRQKRNFDSIRYVLDFPRKELYERIDQRVIQMIENGLVDEVKSVAHFSHLQSMNTVGYKEISAHLSGEITLDEAISQIQQNSRRYAKRQLTWFRRDNDNQWLSSATSEGRLNEIIEDLRQKEIIS